MDDLVHISDNAKVILELYNESKSIEAHMDHIREQTRKLDLEYNILLARRNGLQDTIRKIHNHKD